MSNILNEQVVESYGQGYEDGVRLTLKYLRDEVYGAGIEDTDVWKDFFGNDKEDND